MLNKELKELIDAADNAINREDFSAVLEFYSDDAVLVVKPGLVAKGKEQIRKAFEAIAKYFNHSLVVKTGDMAVIEAGDTALVISKTFLKANEKKDSAFSMERASTYVFKTDAKGTWRCVIDNSYGTELLDQ